MEIINTVYKEIKEWKEKRGVWSSLEMEKEGFFEKYKEFTAKIISLEGQKIKIDFVSKTDLFTAKGVKTGKIKVVDGEIRFYEGRKTARYYRLDAGMYEGFYATLIPLKIETI